ncbi:MAG TPA: AAA family ATPase [Gemmatimonadaceae bacterium]|jgi:wobble nucleotide-excising tRNase
MLNKVLSVVNVGRFASYSATGDVQFRRYTLIFAENGRGKTTFCAILRSLSLNRPDLIIGRQTLGAASPPVITLRISDNNISFRNGQWSEPVPDMAVFDSTYVSENVYAGDSVETEHRRNLYRVILGSEGVALANRMTDIDSQLRTQNDSIRANRDGMRRYLAGGLEVDEFIELPVDRAVDEKIASKEQELAAIKRSEELGRRPDLGVVSLPVVPPEVSQVLARTLGDIGDDSLAKVREHMAAHHMATNGEAWLERGMAFTGETCPFCGQATAGLELLQSYRAFFSREYQTLRREVTRLNQEIDGVLGERVASGIVEGIVQNERATDFWAAYTAFERPRGIESESARRVLAELRSATLDMLSKKASAPLESVAPDERFTNALRAFEGLRTSLGAYNAEVAAANVRIQDVRRQAQVGSAVEVERALARLQAQKARFGAEAIALCERDSQLQLGKTTVEREKSTTRAQLDDYTGRVIRDYGDGINRYLERFNAAFRITSPTHTYRGGSPSTSYQIVINRIAVDLGGADTPNDRPSFKNTLSSGDRSTLALAFFLAYLERDPRREHKIAVFDDPFTSMDSFRRASTAREIFLAGRHCAQVILLSHDSSFLNELWTQIEPQERKTLTFARLGEENTRIVEWDIEQALLNPNRANIEAVRRYVTESDGDARSIAGTLRLIIEAYARNVCPTQFDGCGTMGEIVDRVRTVGTDNPLFAHVDELDNINRFARRYHHPDNPNAGTEPVSDAEVHGFGLRTLRLVGLVP